MTTIDDARRTLIEARSGLEAERDAITEQIDRLNVAIGALGSEWVPVAQGIERSSNEQFAVADGIVPPPVVPANVDDPFANPVTIEPTSRLPRATRAGSIDWAGVVETVREMKADGTYSLAALVAHYGTTHVKNWKNQAKALGISLDWLTPSVDHQAARDAAATTAAPDTGYTYGATGYEPSTPRPTRPQPPAPKFTVDDAMQVIEGAA